MEVKLLKAGIDDAEILWKMQVEAFQDLYEKYQDKDTSPATETVNEIIMRLAQPHTFYYYIVANGERVGVVRVVDEYKNEVAKRIAPIFILPQYRNKGLAQRAIKLAENIHGSKNWELNTILQEQANCHLYEKMGYSPTGEKQQINKAMTLVYYKK